MLAGDSGDFPTSFVFSFELSGRVDTSRLKLAVERCVERHPLMFSTIDSNQKNWCFRPELASSVFVADDMNSSSLRTIDLFTEIGLRIIVADKDASSSEILFVFHHACVDGLGALQFIQDVGAAYETEPTTPGQTPESQEADRAIEYLRKHRRSYGGNRWLHMLRWPLDLFGMLWSFEMIFNRPTPFQPQKSIRENLDSGEVDSSERQTGSLAISNQDLSLTLEQTQTVMRSCKREGQTLNDRVMEAFFFGIQAWNEEFHPENAGGLTRLLIPMNLRKSKPQSAANMVAMVNFDRVSSRWKSRDRFRKWLRMEMGWVKRLRVGVIANRYLQIQELLLGHWPMQRDQQKCFATCLISNVGVISPAAGGAAKELYFGDLKVNNLHVVAPLRPSTNIFAVVFSFGGHLRFDVTFNSDLLTADHVQSLLDRVLVRLLDE